MQGPGWALVLDMCGTDSEQQKRGNAIVSTLGALSGIMTNLLGFADLVKWFPFFQDNAHALFYIGVIVVIVTLIPTLLAAKEKRYVDAPDAPKSSVFREIHASIFSTRLWLNQTSDLIESTPNTRLYLLVWIVELWGWCWWCSLHLVPFLLINFTSLIFLERKSMGKFAFPLVNWLTIWQTLIMWLELHVDFSGDPEASPYSEAYEDYQEGVRMGSLGFAFMQTVVFLYSPLLPVLLSRIGVKVSSSGSLNNKTNKD
jgi:hypothetical protein